MEQVFNRLSKIKQVDSSDELYAKILRRINNEKVISMFWVRAVACAMILIFSSQIYLIKKSQQSMVENDIMIIETNNILYYE